MKRKYHQKHFLDLILRMWLKIFGNASFLDLNGKEERM